ncbi:MAG: AAA family ATPase [Gemmatimonadales bacterium]
MTSSIDYAMPPFAESIRIITLGRCAIEIRAETASTEHAFGPGKPFALMAYLAASPGRAAGRELLLDLLWSDADPERARNSLRQAIWLLRSRLGDTVLATDGDRVSLSRSVAVDRDEFLAAVQSGDPALALGAYRGPFLPELAAPGGAQFEHWADIERQHLHAAYVRAAELGARHHLDAGHPRLAIEVATQLRSREPLREASWRLLIEALLADQSQLAAATEADGMLRMLRDEGREPEPASRRLVVRVEAAATPTSVGPTPRQMVAELIGREAEFSIAMRLWQECRQGSARHFHLTAEAGIGKTRLIEDVTARIRSGGGRVIVVRGRATERHVPWMVAGDLVRALSVLPGAAAISPAAAATLVGMEPELSVRFPGAVGPIVGTDELARHRSAALRELIGAVSHETPLLLAIDDVHWVDRRSWEMIGLALARVREHSVFVVTATRPEADIGDLPTPDAHATLLPLTPVQVVELLASLGTLPLEPWARALAERTHQATDGNPLLVLETVAALTGRGLLQVIDEEWHSDDPDALIRALIVPVGFAERLARLSPGVRDVIEALAILPVGLSVGALGRACERDPVELRAGLDELGREGMATERNAVWEPAHDRVRDRIVALMDADHRATLGARLSGSAALDPEVPARLLPALAPMLAPPGAFRDLEQVYRRWTAARRAVGDYSSDRTLARDLLGPAASDALVTRLLRARPLTTRIGGGRAVAAAFGALVLLGGWGARAWVSRPTKLALVVAPVGIGGPGIGIVPAPVVEIEDRFGRRVPADTSLVSVRITGHGRVVGDSVVRAVAGRAVFDNIADDDPGALDSVTFLFEAPGLTQVRFATPAGNSDVSLGIVSGALNGQRLDPSHPEVIVGRDAEISGAVTFDYITRWAAAAVMLGVVATWRPGPAGIVSQIPLVTPIEHGRSDLSVRVRAPSVPGRYHLVFALGAEPDFKWVASGTNWSWGTPKWGDGNDVAEWSDSVLDQARRIGRMTNRLLAGGPLRIRPTNVPSRVVDVVVR